MTSSLVETSSSSLPVVTNGKPAPPPPDKHGSSSSKPARTAVMEPNVHSVVFGNLVVKPWYPSFYPEELVGRTTERLYVCQWCFKYSKELMPFLGHAKVCPLRDGNPPGSMIYSNDGYSIYEVDGEAHKLYTQNLSLFAKLFLDTKSVFYDVTTFLYYLLVSDNPSPSPSVAASKTDPPQRQVVGFFSKEKMSWDNNNLACILVFPPWQRKGLGQILMGVSYELSKKEGRLGGPEKPLSSPGRHAYSSYWSHTLARILLQHPSSTTTTTAAASAAASTAASSASSNIQAPSSGPGAPQHSKPLTVRDLSNITYILPEDIVSTLQSMQVLEPREAQRHGRAAKEKERGEGKGEAELELARVDRRKLKAWAEKHGVAPQAPVNVGGFVEGLWGVKEEEDDEEDEGMEDGE